MYVLIKIIEIPSLNLGWSGFNHTIVDIPESVNVVIGASNPKEKLIKKGEKKS